MLTDLEYRVWTQYLLSADDFGVMRCSATTLRSDNDALHRRPEKVVQKALNGLATVHLIEVFEHQGRRYVCQVDWVKYQCIEYPRATMHPCPPAELLALMEPTTQTLFKKHPGGVGRPKKSRTDAEPFQNRSQTDSEPFPNGFQTEKELARARPRETQTLTLTQTLGESEGDDLPGKVRALCERYPEIFLRVRKAHYQANPVRDFPHFQNLARGWPLDRLEKMLEVFLLMSPKDANNVPGTPGQFAHMAPECDRRLRENGL